jgi:hypothetical protein
VGKAGERDSPNVRNDQCEREISEELVKLFRRFDQGPSSALPLSAHSSTADFSIRRLRTDAASIARISLER